MKRATFLFIIVVIFYSNFSGCSKPKYDTGILAGTLIDGNGGEPKKNQLILINNGKIEAIEDGDEKDKYQFGNFIDAQDKFVIPGLYDMHGHITMNYRTLNLVNGIPEMSVTYDQPSAEWTLNSLLYYGVMSVRETADFLDEGLALQAAVKKGELAGPEIFTCGPLLEFSNPMFKTMSVVVRTPEEARAEVQRESKAGIQFIKVYVNMPTDILKVIIDEAHKNKVRVLGHLGTTTWKQAIEAGIDGLVHAGPYCDLAFTNLHSDTAINLLKLMADKKVANDPTLIITKNILDSKYGDSIVKSWPFTVPVETKKGWDQQNKAFSTMFPPDYNFDGELKLNLEYVNMAYRTGVPLLLGTDFNNPNIIPGYSLHQELQLFSDAGIPNDKIIKIATHDAAEWLGVLSQSGTIEKDKNADILILNKNPLENISNTLSINNAMHHGKIIEREKLLTKVR